MSIYCPFCEALGIEATVSILDIDPYYGHFEESGKFIPWNTGKKREPFTDEWKHNMSLAQIGKRHTEETKQKISEKHKGRIFSSEHRRRIGEAKKDASFYKDPEYKEKQRLGRLGKKHSIETRMKMSLSQTADKHPMYGKLHSDETKKKMSESRTGKKRGPYKKRIKDGSISRYSALNTTDQEGFE